MSENKGLLGRIVAAGQDAAEDFKDELFGNPKFANMLSQAIERVRNARRTFDTNLQLAFNALNLPTRADYASLLGKIDKMNQAVSDLESRIDDLIASAERLSPSDEAPKKKK